MKYTILDNIDDQERMELRPKYGMTFLYCFFHSKLKKDYDFTVEGRFASDGTSW